MCDIDLEFLPEDLKKQLGALTSLNLAATKVFLQNMSKESKQLLVDRGYVRYDDNGRAIIYDSTRALIRACRVASQ